MEDISKVFWVGIGCQKGVYKSVIEAGITAIFNRYNLVLTLIKGVATIDFKAKEPGLVEFCRDRNLPLVTFSSEILNGIHVPHSSPLVASKVGSFSVAEAAAICAAKSSLIVPKQIFKEVGELGSITIAIAAEGKA